ncbi:MAG TPA: hypothetical protein DIU48_08140 [Acidobacteria bacterium]|nr:hypothetical protein [Acidobacteriota bacterium]
MPTRFPPFQTKAVFIRLTPDSKLLFGRSVPIVESHHDVRGIGRTVLRLQSRTRSASTGGTGGGLLL